MPIGVIDGKGRFQIPQAVRDALGIKPGDAVFYGYEDGEVRLRKAEDPYGPVVRMVWVEHASGKTRRLEDVTAEYQVDSSETVTAVDPRRAALKLPAEVGSLAPSAVQRSARRAGS